MNLITSQLDSALVCRNNSVLVVAAHPDDEVLGASHWLLHARNPFLFHATDGAPRNLHDARRLGFASAGQYAAARREELLNALAIAGRSPNNLVGSPVPDQESAAHLAGLATQLATLITGLQPTLVITHAYEGGHPDHDACAFISWAASRLAQRAGFATPPILEFATYHRDGGQVRRHVFAGAVLSCAHYLSPEDREKKAAMLACFHSQSEVLQDFTSNAECYRAAPEYNFRELPPVSELNYEHYGWGMAGKRFLEYSRIALEKLKL